MSSYRQVLSHRVSSTLFLSSTASVLGDWMGFAALVILAFQRSGTVIGPAALFTAQGLAAVASTVVLGSKLDRVDRRQGIMGGYLLGALAVALPLTVAGIWPLYVTAALVGALRPLTAALRHATVGHDLPPNLLGPTIALEGSTGQFVVALGLVLGGTVAVVTTPETALLLDAVTFLFAGVYAARLPSGRGASAARRNWAVGYRTLFSDAPTQRLTLLLVGSGFVGSLPETLAAVGSQGDVWLPPVLAAQALGTALGSFVLGLGRRFEQPSGLMALTLFSGVTLVVGALLFETHPAILALANLLFGIGFAFTITARTAFTRRIPPQLLGAAVAATITLLLLSEAIGSIALAALAEATAPGVAYAAAAVLLLGLALLASSLPWERSARD